MQRITPAGHPAAGELTTPDLPIITAGLRRLQELQVRCLRGEVTGPDIEAELARKPPRKQPSLPSSPTAGARSRSTFAHGPTTCRRGNAGF